jgi:starvation-inducible DNA-binding protein
MQEINIGLSSAQREALAKGLAVLLADSYTLYLKTHFFHWNVTGPHFKSLHELFELQYTELALAVDTIAERIRALGHTAPGSYAAFSKLTSIKEETQVPAASKMVELLVDGHETVIRTARDLLAVVNAAEDEVTLGLLAARMDVHEKTAWMLRSMVAA